MVYYVSPTSDQLDWDEDGLVDGSLFVLATDASEAIKLWRAYYELDQDDESSAFLIDLTERVRVHEVPIMPKDAPSAAIGWDHVPSPPLVGEITASVTYDMIAGADDSFHGSSV